MSVVAFPMKKPENMLCGNACIKVLEACYTKVIIATSNIEQSMRWSSELANCLSRNGVDVSLHCWNSNLYNDYIVCLEHQDIIHEVEGFKALFDYECAGGKVYLTQPVCEIIKEQLNEGPIIICVSSTIWHNDVNLSGGHFIVLLCHNEDGCLVADPGKETISLIYHNIDYVLQAMQPFGGWRICCKIDENVLARLEDHSC